MVLEALAAVSLAGAVVQFVQFTTSLASKSNEFHKSVDGTIKEHIEVREYAEHYSRLSQRLKTATQVSSILLSDYEAALLAVANRSLSKCQEIMQVLDRLQQSKHKKSFSSLRAALKAVWNEEKVESCFQELRLVREELVVHLLVVIKSVTAS